jgi:hypothetical protein
MDSMEQQEIYVTIWSKVIDTQMHFNEMAVKSRQFGLGFVAAALGLGVVLLAKSEEFTLLLFGYKLHATVVIAAASAVALAAVRHLDLHVYHKMLRGAVAFGEDFEEHYMKQIFSLNKGMTQAISHFSRYDDAAVKAPTSGTTVAKYVYTGTEGQKRSALRKLERFYQLSIRTLVIIAILLAVVTNLNVGDKRAVEPAPPSAAKVK